LAPWGNHELHTFLNKWSTVWQEHIQPTLQKKRLAEIDPVLITGWLEGSARGYSPLELTMLVWASYVGDVRGPNVGDCYESYISRFLSPNECRSAQATALDWITSWSGFLPERNIQRGTPVSDMVQAGMLTKHLDNRISFRNPAVGSYLAAREMAENGIAEEATPIGWAPAEAAMKYLASMVDVGSVADRHLEVRNEVLQTHLLTVATWLPEAPAGAEWRAKTLRNLATVANTSDNPFGLRLRAIHALAASKEMSVNILFQRLLSSNYPSSRVLGALGLGGLGDEDAIQTLEKTIQEKQNMHTRQAACLALGAVGTEAALEVLGRFLLESEEGIRIAAAEALACNPGEGYAMLREAVEYKDHMTRRAAVYGIARIPDDWALDTLLNLQVEDDQWVVRGAAAEAVDQRTKSPVTIDPIIQDPSQLPWLVEFAARDGLGVAPGKASMEMVRRALNKGTPDEQVAALEAIAWSGESDLTMELIQSLNSDQTHLRDAAFEALWQLQACGVQIGVTPNPA
jgi:HEAT repeat protein